MPGINIKSSRSSSSHSRSNDCAAAERLEAWDWNRNWHRLVSCWRQRLCWQHLQSLRVLTAVAQVVAAAASKAAAAAAADPTPRVYISRESTSFDALVASPVSTQKLKQLFCLASIKNSIDHWILIRSYTHKDYTQTSQSGYIHRYILKRYLPSVAVKSAQYGN